MKNINIFTSLALFFIGLCVGYVLLRSGDTPDLAERAFRLAPTVMLVLSSVLNVSLAKKIKVLEKKVSQ